MLILEINGKEKEIPCQWEEMTIDYYCGIYQIINKYKKTEEQKEEEKEKNLEKFYFVHETKMYKELFSYMTEIPMEMVDQGIDSFTYDNEIYYFPFEFMKTGTFGDYIESNQLELSTKYLKNGRFDILPEQMAILCKKVDEEVDLDNIDEKAKKFKNLTMDIVWEFSFFLSKRTIKSLSVIRTFSEMAAQKA